MTQAEYKIQQLKKMLAHETSQNETHYGAHLTHWHGDAAPINIDAGAIKALIRYYKTHDAEKKEG